MGRDDDVILKTGGHVTMSQALRTTGDEACSVVCISEERDSRRPADIQPTAGP